jgi:hypothetical protein
VSAYALTRFDGISRIDPGIEAACERADGGEAVVHQPASHTGRRRFVGSRAVEDDLFVRREVAEIAIELIELGQERRRDAP